MSITIFSATALSVLSYYIKNSRVMIGIEIAFELLAALVAVLIGEHWRIRDGSVKAGLLEMVFPAVACIAIITGISYFCEFDVRFFITRLPFLPQYLRLDWLWLKVAQGFFSPCSTGFVFMPACVGANGAGKKRRSRKNKVFPIA